MTREDKLLFNLVGAGLSSALARKALAAGYTLTSLKKTSRGALSASFSAEEVEVIRGIQRSPIPPETVQRLVEECDWKCCLCWDWDRARPVVIHHIVAHTVTADDDYDNLVLLCSTHHDEVHYRSDTARPPYPPEYLRQRKRDWSERVAKYRSGIGPKPGHEPPPLPTSVSPIAPPADFIGRPNELAEIQRRINEGKTVVVHGMGGVGKTALVSKAAADTSPHRAALAGDLGRVSGAAATILRAWAQACGVESNGVAEEELVDIVRSALAARKAAGEHLLLIVDDVRAEWIEAAQMLRWAVPAGVPALFTGRDASLAGTLNASPLYLEELSDTEGGRLLKALAGNAIEQDAPVTELVAALGGLPLALELAGRRLSIDARRPGPGVARLLLAVQEGASRALAFPGRRGLSAVFSVTYDSLPDHLQRLFRVVGGFASTTFSYSDLASVLRRVGDAGREDDVQALVEAALLDWTHVPGQYRIHPLLHQHASELLSAAGETETIGLAHAVHFQEFVGARDEPDAGGLDEIEQRLPEVMAALRFLLERGAPGALAFVQSLWLCGVLQMRGYLTGVEELIWKAIGLARLASHMEFESHFLGHLGSLYAMTGRPEMAVDVLGHAVTLSSQLGLEGDEAAHRGNLGIALGNLGRTREAVQSHRRALDLALSSKRIDAAVDQLSHLAAIARQSSRGRTGPDADRARQEAIQLYQGALDLLDMLDSDEASMRSRRGSNLSNLGLIYEDLGQYERAEGHIRQGLEIARQEGDLRGIANRTGHLANLVSLQGRFAEAIPLYRDAARLAEQASAPRLQATWLYNLGFFRVRIHPDIVSEYTLDDALATLKEAWTIAEEVQYVEMMGQVMYAVGLLHHFEGRQQHAVLAMTKAVELLEEVGSPAAPVAWSSLQGLTRASQPSPGGRTGS